MHSPEARKRAVVTSHQGESLTRSVATRRYAVALGSSIGQVMAMLAVAVAVEGASPAHGSNFADLNSNFSCILRILVQRNFPRLHHSRPHHNIDATPPARRALASSPGGAPLAAADWHLGDDCSLRTLRRRGRRAATADNAAAAAGRAFDENRQQGLLRGFLNAASGRECHRGARRRDRAGDQIRCELARRDFRSVPRVYGQQRSLVTQI